MLTFLIIAGLLLLGIFYTVVIYNALIDLKNQVFKNWSNIDVLLAQRNSEITKLVESCKQYMKYEKETLEKIIQARNAHQNASQSGDMQALGNAENLLRAGLRQIFALAENYPDLKSNNSFTQLQSRISGLESAISDRREFYNESVNLYNIRIQQIPEVFLANILNFKPSGLLRFSDEEKRDLDIKNLFNS